MKSRKLPVISDPDIDSCVAFWMFLRGQKPPLKFVDVDLEFVRSGTRATPEQIAGREAIHIDTGMQFDGTHNFDHHQNDPAVREECATTLVYKSLFHGEEDDPDGIIGIMAEYVRFVDHGLGKEGSPLIRDSQFGNLLRDLSVLLHALSYTQSKLERIRIGHLLLDAFYEAVRNELMIAAELNVLYLQKVKTPFGTVLFGDTVRGHKEVRAFVRRRWYEHIDVMILRYGDNSVGITLVKQREHRRLNLRIVRDMVRKVFPEYARRDDDSRVFLHPKGYVLYIHSDGHDQETMPTVDDLFDIAREAFAAS